MGSPKDSLLLEREIITMVYTKEIRIDDQGRIWRIGYKKMGVVHPCEPHRAESKGKSNYLEFRTPVNGVRRHCAAHRLVYQYFKGDIPKGYTINHINGVPDDNRPENLEIMTVSQQNAHAFRIGAQSARGEDNNNASLTRAQVKRMRMMHKTGEFSQLQLSEMFGVSAGHVSRIIRKVSWE